MLPDNLGVLFYSLERLNSTVENLVFHHDTIEGRVQSTYVYLSSYFLHHLIEKTNLSREELYRVVQTAAFESQKENNANAFKTIIEEELKKKDIELSIPTVDFKEVKNIFLKHVDKTFERCL